MTEISAQLRAPTFSAQLRHWRKRAGLSQLALALMCDSAQKHISFLETGRSQPSRAMVLSLCGALNVPLRASHAMLRAAGFAPHESAEQLSDQQRTALHRAATQILTHFLPNPAVMLDHHHNVCGANPAALAFQCMLFGAKTPAALPSFASNIVRATLHPDGIRDRLLNWREIAALTLRRLHADVLLSPFDRALKDLFDEVVNYDGVPGDWLSMELCEPALNSPQELAVPVMPLRFQSSGGQFSAMSLITTLGTPIDSAAQEMRIESFSPSDDPTAALFARLAKNAAALC